MLKLRAIIKHRWQQEPIAETIFDCEQSKRELEDEIAYFIVRNTGSDDGYYIRYFYSVGKDANEWVFMSDYDIMTHYREEIQSIVDYCKQIMYNPSKRGD